MRNLLGSLFRWAIVLAALIFVGKAFADNWQQVSSLEISYRGWRYAAAALGAAFISHLCQGILWRSLLNDLGRRVSWRWSLGVFLTLELIKYLPGNIWHLYGRIRIAHQEARIPVGLGTTSVLLEPTLITAAGMALALFHNSQLYIQVLCSVGLVSILIGVHPVVFAQVLRGLGQIGKTPVIAKIRQWLGSQRRQRPQPFRLQRYPFRAVIGGFILMGLRSTSFILVIWIFADLKPEAIPPIVGGFAFAWILGVILPGAPGGVGVFEATAIALLRGLLATGPLLAALGVYRLISLLAEILGVGFGWFLRQRYRHRLKTRPRNQT